MLSPQEKLEALKHIGKMPNDDAPFQGELREAFLRNLRGSVTKVNDNDK